MNDLKWVVCEFRLVFVKNQVIDYIESQFSFNLIDL